MKRNHVPLIGLLDDGILPGEERPLSLATLGRATHAALQELVGKTLVVVTVTSEVELPSLVAQRYATACEVRSCDEAGVVLRGTKRVQILAAEGREGAFTAEVLVANDVAPSLAGLLGSARTVLDAVDGGAVPDVPEWPARLEGALVGLVRALGAPDVIADIQRSPPTEALTRLSHSLVAQTPAVKASHALERAVAELHGPADGKRKGAKRDVSVAMQRRLWSQVVEIQKRLDIYDPGVGKDGDDLGLMQRRLMQAGMPKVAREAAKRELRLLQGMAATHHDHSTYYGHLDFMSRLPWQPDELPPIDLEGVSAALEKDHYGLEKAKRRVLEYLAVRALGGESSSMVLCLSGPPGVGKTTVARSIASALGRKFVRVALGGVHDESEIRGHRLSFVASSAGRILKGLAQVGSASAVVLLDEIDKIGAERQRSPAAALLEVLDPEQNGHFMDNYLGVPFDLSHVLFIATANDVSAMHPALRDRMEPIEIEGYTAAEKVRIAATHLLPRVAREVGLDAPVPFSDAAISALVEQHTAEAGVRQLKRKVGELYRARALTLVKARALSSEGATAGEAMAEITEAELVEVLGPPRYLRRALPEHASVGVAAGLSVSGSGGALLFLEAGVAPGRGRLQLTGSLGKVMSESIETALSYARIHWQELGLPKDHLRHDVHLHAPEGGTPKDGPSAGVAVLVAIVSAFRGVAPAGDVAMTGEISLTGNVLPVGGVRAKVLAAERAGVVRVIVPAENLVDVPKDTGVVVVAVRTVAEALAAAFLPVAAPEAPARKPKKPRIRA